MARNLFLVTGAPGWLGTRLVRSLVEGIPEVAALRDPDRDARVRCLVLGGLDPSPLTRISERVETRAGDVRERGSLGPFFEASRGATLFHLAGIIHPRRIRDLFEINVEGSRNILEAAVAAGVRRIVAVSSNSPAGCNGRADHLFDESSPYRPYMQYGRSKMLMEQMLERACAAGRIETVVVRPCWFYGPEQPARQTRFFTMIRRGKAPIVGSGESRRSMSYVDNTCQGLLLAARTEAARGRTYWIADRRPYSMNEIVGTVERLLESEFRLPVRHGRLRLPELASEIAWAADALVQGLGRYVAEIHVLSEMNKTIACSIARAERELGYAPTIELEEGMRRSIRWCLDRGMHI